MKRWDLTSLPPSTEKRTPRSPGPDAPRVRRQAGQIPRVLFSSPECRAVLIELDEGETMGEHHVRERAVVHVIAGRVGIDCGDESATCAAGTLVMFHPAERHSVRALARSQLLLILAPWPASQHYTDADASHAHRLPANASVAPEP